jgi:hypothetical protein
MMAGPAHALFPFRIRAGGFWPCYGSHRGVRMSSGLLLCGQVCEEGLRLATYDNHDYQTGNYPVNAFVRYGMVLYVYGGYQADTTVVSQKIGPQNIWGAKLKSN